DLRFFSESLPIINFPSYNILPFKFLSYHNETAAKRISALYRLTEYSTPPIVVTTADAVLQKLIPRKELLDYTELIMEGEDTDPDALVSKLVSGGYVRSAIVEEPGDFSIRGGILDIFSPLYPDPLRIELFGDTVESLRFFSASTQRTVRNISEAIIIPAREAILKKEHMSQIIKQLKKQSVEHDISVAKTRDLIDRISNEGVFPGIESLIPLIYPKLDTFFDYMPDNSLFILAEPKELGNAAEIFQSKALKNYRDASSEDRLCVEPDALYLKWPDAKQILLQKKPLSLKMLPGTEQHSENSLFHFPVQENSSLRAELKQQQDKENLFSPLADWITDKKQAGSATLLVCSTSSQAERLISILTPYGIQPIQIPSFPQSRMETRRGFVYICIGQLSSGFVWHDEYMSVLTDSEIFGPRQSRRKTPARKVHTELLAFGDLKKDDLIVHVEHGIGQYEGLVKLSIERTANDFLLIVYKDGDKLYLPVDRMSMVQKYMGVDGIAPVLDKMGGKSWERVKNKVKKSAEKMAGELLKLYAERRVREGFAHTDAGSDFRNFEAGFPFEETPDQVKAIDEVLNDMAEPTPMDRLVCGDVGYGKTEVALRASFVTVYNGRQVAVLVPTTVLAEQHFATFSSRFEDFPVNVACLSRFRSSKEQREIISGLKSGTVDIVIGTHRLVQKDVELKNVGLVVIDEEQRFGVRHKEKLKKLRATVDVLALTATPIPRTLHMSMMGIRDISIISTPPEDRHAIVTYISEFDDAIISEAIKKELDRKGQIFFVHNNIRNIEIMADHLRKLVPEVRLDIAHGRLNEDQLEKVMHRFMKRESDMLVTTTIIESGLDVSSANTILINRADRFGLAQIYQLRGRVGRADEQAYAYLFIPNETILTKDAQKRLKVLMEHSDLGSGFQIAMSDLRIRGGGTILGASQSGHIAAVGYEMFLQLMESAMAEQKGEPIQDGLEPEINISMSSFLPESYIPDIDQRLQAYRRLSKMTDLKEISEFKGELTDRFGALPEEAANLLLKIMLKVLSIKAGVKRLDLSENQLILFFSEAHQKNPFGIVDMVVSDEERFEFTPDHVLKARLTERGGGSPVAQTRSILKEIVQRVN
ncbi:MAG: transcription-repair coupling factor, partial [Desulfobacteraceae bacterium]|nr:transcription-repair coupling factor [Desulfobacteraceae bacterium]